METIYDQVMQCQKRMTLKCFKTNVTAPLVDLLKIICGLDLSKELHPFVPDGGSLSLDVTFYYKFKYGKAAISGNELGLTVIFYFDYEYREELKIPFYANNCIVNVDNNLNFIKAGFNDYIAISNKFSEPECKERHFFGVMFIHNLELNKTYNSLFYNVDEFDEYVEITDDVDNRFHIHNFEFELLLVNFIRFSASDPIVFYSCFSKYPSYNDFITDKTAIVTFVNLFIEQYFNDHANLIHTIDQHLLLVDMQDI